MVTEVENLGASVEVLTDASDSCNVLHLSKGSGSFLEAAAVALQGQHD